MYGTYENRKGKGGHVMRFCLRVFSLLPVVEDTYLANDGAHWRRKAVL